MAPAVTFVLSRVTAALSRVSPELLRQIASRISMTTGRSVSASAEGISSTLKSLVTKQNLFWTAITAVTFYIPDLFEEEDFAMLEDLPVAQVFKTKVLETLRADRQRHLGDGEADSVNGEPKEVFREQAAQLLVYREVLDAGERAAGGRRAFDSLRAAMLMDDDTIEMVRAYAN